MIRFSSNQQDMQFVFGRISNVVSDRPTQSVGIKVENNTLTASTADNSLAVYSQVACQASVEGYCFVPAKLFLETIRQLPPGMIEVEQQPQCLSLVAGNQASFKTKIPLKDSQPWREPVRIESTNRASLESSKLSYVLEKVAFCIDPDSPKNYATVGYLHRGEADSLRLVGTDGYRLSYCEVKLDMDPGFLKEGVCLSKRFIDELIKVANFGVEQVEICISEDGKIVSAQVPGYQVYSALSQVKFPAYRSVIPKDTGLHKVYLSKGDINKMARRVLIAADATHSLRFNFSNENLMLSAQSPGGSESKEYVEKVSYQGSEEKIALNGRYLIEALQSMSAEDMSFQFKTGKDPVLITPQGEPEGCHSLNVIVPLQESM
jgi:DNA polymerase III subunit beta